MQNPAVKILALALLAFPAIAWAQGEAAKAGGEQASSNTYQPDPCEFSVTFPEAPYKSRRCDPDDVSKCYDQVSFTKVYDMESTVNFRVTCNPVDEAIQKNYTKEVMEATLRAMTRRSAVETFDTSYREETDYRQAGLAGQGESGTLPTIYIAQLWMGKKSALTVEGELIGETHEKADKLFSEILKSVHFVKPDETKEKPAEKPKKE